MVVIDWFKLLRPYIVSFLLIQVITRIFLFCYSYSRIQEFLNVTYLFKVFSVGMLFDIQVLFYSLLIIILLHLFVRKKSEHNHFYYAMRFSSFVIFTYIWLFTACAEFFFWQEFGTRFNFIAVDYLVYTREVVGNIVESYPLQPLLLALGGVTLIITWLLRKDLKKRPTIHKRGSWVLVGALLLVLPFLFNFIISDSMVPNFKDSLALQELSKNGTYALFYAYRNNELNYKNLYPVLSQQVVDTHIRQLLDPQGKDFLNKNPNNIVRIVKHNGPEIHKNVVMVVMESLSASFMQTFGNTNNLTPNLDRLGREGLIFTNLYATGTRTVRGLEALTLSIPPTPGQSIVRRNQNNNLFTIGSVFRDRGYDTAFIYGGYGLFDNMNAYFENNGFRILDRVMVDKKEIQFANIWGICDEDLYKQVIKQADQFTQKKQPFFYVVMTTSNHLPFTFPSGKIDLPSYTGGRNAGVKYADYAIGAFLEEAKTRPWFKDTVFIFVADHTAGVAGKTEINISEYHIPAIFYAPGFIKPQEVNLLASQIDMPPVLLGILNFSYYSKFFGEDWLNPTTAVIPRAFISNYQKVGLLRDGYLSILGPKRTEFLFKNEVRQPLNINPQLIIDAITYYQFSSDWRQHMAYIPSVITSDKK